MTFIRGSVRKVSLIWITVFIPAHSSHLMTLLWQLGFYRQIVYISHSGKGGMEPHYLAALLIKGQNIGINTICSFELTDFTMIGFWPWDILLAKRGNRKQIWPPFPGQHINQISFPSHSSSLMITSWHVPLSLCSMYTYASEQMAIQGPFTSILIYARNMAQHSWSDIFIHPEIAKLLLATRICSFELYLRFLMTLSLTYCSAWIRLNI